MKVRFTDRCKRAFDQNFRASVVSPLRSRHVWRFAAGFDKTSNCSSSMHFFKMRDYIYIIQNSTLFTDCDSTKLNLLTKNMTDWSLCAKILRHCTAYALIQKRKKKHTLIDEQTTFYRFMWPFNRQDLIKLTNNLNQVRIEKLIYCKWAHNVENHTSPNISFIRNGVKMSWECALCQRYEYTRLFYEMYNFMDLHRITNRMRCVNRQSRCLHSKMRIYRWTIFCQAVFKRWDPAVINSLSDHPTTATQWLYYTPHILTASQGMFNWTA